MVMDRVFIPLKNCKLTMNKMMSAIRWLQETYPGYEIFMDGDRFAIVGRMRA
jgi:hypothetical protein